MALYIVQKTARIKFERHSIEQLDIDRHASRRLVEVGTNVAHSIEQPGKMRPSRQTCLECMWITQYGCLHLTSYWNKYGRAHLKHLTVYRANIILFDNIV